MLETSAQQVLNDPDRGFWLPPVPRLDESSGSTSQNIPNTSTTTTSDCDRRTAAIQPKSVA